MPRPLDERSPPPKLGATSLFRHKMISEVGSEVVIAVLSIVIHRCCTGLERKSQVGDFRLRVILRFGTEQQLSQASHAD